MLYSFYKKNATIISLCFLVAAISSLPYTYGSLSSKKDLYFLGRSVVNGADTYPLLANIESARQGKIILPNLYSIESKTPFMIRPTYLFLGNVATVLRLESITAYHVGKFSLAVVFVFVLWKFIGLFINTKKKKWIALIIVLLSSGFGYFVKNDLPLSIDLWVPESNTFFSLIESPHFISAQIFLLCALYFLYKYSKNLRKTTYLLISSLFASFLILEHPFMIPFVFVYVPLSLLITQGKKGLQMFKNIVLYFLLPLLTTSVIYYLYLHSLSARLMNSQNILTTPSFIHVASGYGLLIVFSFLGALRLNIKQTKNKLLVTWVLLGFVLIYAPVSYQRRLIEGLHIPLALLSAIGIFYVFEKMKKRMSVYGPALLLFLVLIATNVYNVWHMISSYSLDTATAYTYHISATEFGAMRWLRDNTNDGDVVLASFYFSNIIPGITGRFVFNGHRIQSYKSEEKQELVDRFMGASDSEFRVRFLRANKIHYIFFGKNDPYNQYRSSFQEEPYVKKVFDREGVLILKIVGV